MTLKIVKSSDPITVDRINICIYGAPGIGKTSLGFTAQAPILFDFDNGVHRAANRKDAVRVTQWSEVTAITESDIAEYDTVIIDTAGRALDCLSADIIRRNPKMGRAGALTLQGYGQLKAEFVAWLKQLNSFGKDVVLIAHMDEQRNGDEIIERLDVQGGSKGEIYKAADAMGKLTMQNGKPTLNFSPTDASFGKNPGQLEPLEFHRPEIAPDFLAEVIQRIKTKLNTLTEEQRKAQAVIEDWRVTLADLNSADEVNSKIPEIPKDFPVIKTLLHTRALSLGLVPNKATGQYQVKAAA